MEIDGKKVDKAVKFNDGDSFVCIDIALALEAIGAKVTDYNCRFILKKLREKFNPKGISVIAV